MLPAVKIDNTLVTESDDILFALEEQFGSLPNSPPLSDPIRVFPLRKLERMLFQAWCQWLCYPSTGAKEEQDNQKRFEEVVLQVESVLSASPGDFFLEEGFSVVDVIFTPYVERMNASCFYYKGYDLRGLSQGNQPTNQRIHKWFAAMEKLDVYRGTQSDFHTHCHDLPPQMGGCYVRTSVAFVCLPGLYA